MAGIAKAVYMRKAENDTRPDEEGILQKLKQEDDGFIRVTGFDNKSSQAAIVEHNDYICMAFRGTDELEDWLDNIKITATRQLFGSFHLGFWEAVQDIWPPMLARYEEAQKNGSRPLFITGHSLGGAMATIAAAIMMHENKAVAGVYTFGQPRAMRPLTSMKFNAQYKGIFFRFHNNNDIVTRVPAAVGGFRHVGTYLYISEERIIIENAGFWFRFLDYIDGALSHIKKRGLDMIADHDIDEYLAAVKDWNLGDLV
jgi:triacylglycerol lipase